MHKKIIIWLLALSFTFLSCSDNDVTGAGDKTAPAAISDLAIVNVTNSSLELSWTAPGDDGNSGTAKGYDLRYSTTTISTETDWESAIEASNEPTPRAAGAIDSAVISGLTSNVKYYIGLKSVDEAGNWSALSNIVIGTTTPDTIPPAQITDLVIVDSTSYGAILTWTAPGDDGAVGMATRYNVKRDTIEITDANWNTATSCSGIPIPSAAGEMDTMRVTGLKSNTHYYFAIRASDEQNNWSDVSVNDDVTTEAVSVVADLAVVDSARNAITLTWTAPGDAAEGPYTQYDIRYSISTIDSSNWNQASQCKFEPTPGTAGTTETFLVTGLRYDTTHYFAIKSADSALNWSAISNVPSGKTKWSRFAFPRNYATGYGPSCIVSADLNSDSYPDLVTTNKNDNNVNVFLNNGDNSYAAPETFSVGREPHDICVADFNGDNALDLAVANSYNTVTMITTLFNDGNGAFPRSVNSRVGYKPMSITAGDLDGDGDNDIMVACFESDSIYILLNNGNGSFTDPQGWLRSQNDIYVVDANHQIFNAPDSMNVPPDGIIQLYSTTGNRAIYLPYMPSDVILLGRESDDPYHYSLALEQSRYFLWGFTNSPAYMTQTGKDLFGNVLHYMAKSDSSGVFRSTDNGDSWTQINSSLTNTFVFAFTINSSGDIFAGTNGGVLRSTDNGDNWAQINNGLTNTPVQALAVNSSGDIFAGTKSGGVFRSTDNGNSWTQINNGMTDNYINVSAIAIDSSGVIFAGTNGYHVFRSIDNGDSWTRKYSGLSPYVIALAINDSGDIFAGSNSGGVYRSTHCDDDSCNWTQINNGLTNTPVQVLTINSSGDIFAGTNGDGIFRSIDGGGSWTQINDGLTNKSVQALTINSSGDIFAGTGGGVFRSIDNGDSWTQINNGLLKVYIHSLAINSSDDIFAGTGVSIAYVYSTDITTSDKFKSLIESKNFAFTRVKRDTVLSTDFSQFDAIIIGPETGSLDTWGNMAQVSAIDLTNKPIIALGEAGYAYFGKLDLDIGFKYQDDISYPAGDGPIAITSRDIDNDGDSLDLIVSNMNSNNVSVLLYNSSDSTFMPAVNYDVGSGPTSVFLSEFNGDAYLDLAVVNTLSNNMYIMLNNGDGSFAAGSPYATGDGPRSVFAADMDNDGFNDLVVANINSDSVSVYLGNGDGTFQSAINYWAGEGPISVIADFIDGDAYRDLVVANNRSKNFSVLKNMTATR